MFECALRSGPAGVALAFVVSLFVPLDAIGQEAGANPASAAVVDQPSDSYVHDGMAPVARAIRTDQPIVLDGILDEAVWMRAPAISEFLQTVPAEAEPVTEETEVRFLYDDDNIYVGAWLWDEGEVQARLARRDQGVPDADFFVVIFDSYHDHRTAYRFAMSPAGNWRDEIVTVGYGRDGGGFGDASWDPVWDFRTSITDRGWFLEMRVPFSQLRYRADEVQTWGVQVERKLRRKAEDVVWAFRPRNEPQVVARYGHLEGIRDVPQGKRLELLPFVTGRAEYKQVARNSAAGFANPFRGSSEYVTNAGLDLKYLLGTNFTLDATVNPDFGQVELDPAVINLTAFETRFEERRPFFVEGAEIFRFGDSGARPGGSDAQLVYSRRIGRTPQGPVPSLAAYADVPGQTTILGALKLTGKTASGWSVGLLEGVTDRVEAPWVLADGMRGRTEVEPRSNYLAARLRRDFRQGMGSLGVVATGVNRDLGSSALRSRLRSSGYSIGVDGRIEWGGQAWMLGGKLSGSHVGGTADAIARTQQSSARYMGRPDATHMDFDPGATSLSGLYGKVDLAKQTGIWQGSLGATAIAPGYEVNDLGFQSWADRIEIASDFGYLQPQVGQHFRTLNVNASTTGTFNFAGEAVGAELALSLNGEHAGFTQFNARVGHRFATWNDRLTRGGPLTREPSGFSGNVGFSTDRRGVRQYRAGMRVADYDEGGWSRGGNAGVLFRFLENYEVDVGVNLTRDRIAAQYVTTVSDPSATGTFGNRYVFAPLDQTTVGVETRLSMTFSPALTFELYAQPFMSSGDYRDLMELAAPRSFRFLRYGEDVGALSPGADGGYDVDPREDGTGTFQVEDLDFNIRSLLGNAVLRWEWRSGSTLFLVWQQARSETLAPGSENAADRLGQFDLQRDGRALFRLKPDNVFMFKVAYWLNP